MQKNNPTDYNKLFSQMTEERKKQVLLGLACMILVINSKDRKISPPKSLSFFKSFLFMFLSICLTIAILSAPSFFIIMKFSPGSELLIFVFFVNTILAAFAATPLNQFILMTIDSILIKTIKRTLYEF